MICEITNRAMELARNVSNVDSIENSARKQKIVVQSDSFWYSQRTATSSYRLRIEDAIWLELSLVPEVECVYIEKSESDLSFSVLTIVNERSPELRSKIYAREKCLLQAYPEADFDFHILARMGRELGTVVGGREKPYKRATA
jgi:hypothetical protein